MNIKKLIYLSYLIICCSIFVNAQNDSIDYLTYNDISYGPFDKNKFDLYMPKSEKPVPLVVFFHGGGFVEGDKTQLKFQKKVMCPLLSNNIAFASVNYRFRINNDSLGVLRCINDAVLFIKYIRFYSSEYNIDGNKIACYGESAGAGISLFLAFHDNISSETSDETLLSMPTRICCAGAYETQGTYNIFRWRKFIPGLNFFFLVSGRKFKNDIANFYGYESYKTFKPQKKEILAKVDLLNMISTDDPPIWIKNRQKFGFLKNPDHLLHHPKHATVLEKLIKKKRIECYAYTQKTINDNVEEKRIESFLIENLLKE